jgi:uncharacterized coiled-coil protein SlyX
MSTLDRIMKYGNPTQIEIALCKLLDEKQAELDKVNETMSGMAVELQALKNKVTKRPFKELKPPWLDGPKTPA